MILCMVISIYIYQSSYSVCADKLSKCKGLKIAHINLRSLPSKMEEIRFLTNEINIDIVALP